MSEPSNKTVILERLEAERARFEAALAQVSEADMTAVPMQDGWTVKDIVAHVAAWERELLAWLDAAARGERPAIPQPGGWGPYMDEFNARAYAANRDRSLPDVLAESRQVYAQMMAALRALPEDPADPLWAVWHEGRPPWGLLATFYEHYQHHREPIQAWLGRAGGRA